MKRYVLLAMLAAGLVLAFVPSMGGADEPVAKQPSMRITCGSCP
jgi:hypothetical protein